MLDKDLLDSLPFGLLAADGELKLQFVNRWLTDRLPHTAVTRIGQLMGVAFPELEERGLLAAYDMVMHQRQPLELPAHVHRYFLRLPAPQGSGLAEMAQTAHIIPVCGESGIRLILTLIHDASAESVAERQLRREIDKLTALHEIDRLLATLDLGACLQLIVDRTRTLFGGVNAALLLLDGDMLEVVADVGFERSHLGARIAHDEGLTGRTFMRREAILAPDARLDAGYLAKDIRTRSEMTAPLLLRSECLGVINVESQREGAFNESDLEMLELLAARAAAAIHNARLHEAEREQHRLADTLRDIGLILSTELDPQAILDALLEHVARVVPYDSACVMLYDGAARQVRIARARGYEAFGLEEQVIGSEFSLANMVNLAAMAETRQPYYVPDVSANSDWLHSPISAHIGSWAGAPIVARGRVLGFLSLDKTQRGFYTQELANRLAVFAAEAGLALENARLYEEQQQLAVTDGLTGIANRRYFDQEFARELQRAARFGHKTALLMLDVDDFKSYNDAYGHPAGDELLCALAMLLGQSVRSVDTVARYGGEEFALILPESDLQSAAQTAERLRELVSLLPLAPDAVRGKGGNGPVTVSLGVAIAPDHGAGPDELLRAADAALYRAKALGKNRVATAGPGQQDAVTASTGESDGGKLP